MLKKLKNLLYSVIALTLSLFVKRNENYIAFGSWEGKLYLDNSKYLLEYIRSINDGKYKLFWVGVETILPQLPEDVVFIKKNSFKSILPLLRCKYMFFSQMHNADIANFNAFRGAVMVFLNHGICLKKCFTDAAGYSGGLEKKNASFLRKVYGTIVGTYRKYDYFIAASNYHFDTYLSSCAYLGANRENVLKTGTPRNDVLASSTEEQAECYKIRYAERIGFDRDVKVIMYLPTFRRKTAGVSSLVSGDLEQRRKLNKILEQYNAVLIEKNHYAADKFAENNNKTDDFSRLVKLDIEVDIQEMLQFTDVMISDYSGAFMDFLHTDRPIVHYLYDYEYYRDYDSGLYLEKEEFACGEVAENFDELCAALENALSGNDENGQLRKRGRKLFVEYECGRSSQKIFETIIK